MSQTYLVVKALHMVAVIVWMSGMLCAPLLLRILASLEDDRRSALAPRIRELFKLLNTPAMLVTWILGLYLALRGGWISSPGLHVKIVLVLGLSGLHGYYSGQFRKMTEGAPAGSVPANKLLITNVVVLIAICVLVIVKPL